MTNRFNEVDIKHITNWVKDVKKEIKAGNELTGIQLAAAFNNNTASTISEGDLVCTLGAIYMSFFELAKEEELGLVHIFASTLQKEMELKLKALNTQNLPGSKDDISNIIQLPKKPKLIL